MDKVNLQEKFNLFTSHWTPKIVAEVNDQFVKVAKAKGAMPWHAHEDQDELFLVVKGALTLELRDGTIDLSPGECYVVPRGVEHRPSAEVETHFVLVESKTTVNTGNRPSAMTIQPENLERL